jgi:hypothetical protein
LVSVKRSEGGTRSRVFGFLGFLGLRCLRDERWRLCGERSALGKAGWVEA